ncbi:hypothetical protein SSX86_013898 [Deinandra increscens subsp. villosa]|uniref:U1-type domain-containing protein n=1 Tax=Deinandra increscens subsp. villosa TaxID=3103831 RepID=A0AAP0D5J4_9ASTR
MPKHPVFTTPLLPPLQITTYDIPAPVIHPPGSDPTTFLNPNPHHFQTENSSMDVDSCLIASRPDEIIIVANKIDLSASEHAGVILSEATTMESTGPDDYAINSVVVAPLTVKDLVATKTETKNSSFIVSDVYNVTCDSEIAISKHMEGKVVLKNTQKPTGSSTSNQETPPPVADDSLELDQESEKKKIQDLDTTQMVLDSASIKQEKPSSDANETLDQEFDNKNQDLLRKEAAVEPLFVCAIPEPGLEYQKIVTVQMDESLLKTGAPITTSASRPAVQSSNSDAENRPAQTSTGKQHGENINVLETWCEICKVNCNTNYNYNIHQTGKKHIKNLQKLEKIPNPSPPIPQAENLKPTKGEVVNPNEGTSTMCELCAVNCTSRVMFNQHISGRKHQNNLKKCNNQLAPSHALDNKPPSPEPMYEEGEIVVSVRSKRKGDESWASEEDADSKRQKMNEKEGCDLLVICKGCNVVCNGLQAYNTHSCRF